MINTKHTNYLFNLPNSYYIRDRLPNGLGRTMNQIIMSEDNTNDKDLIEFRHNLVELIVNKVKTNGVEYLLSDYFEIRNNLIFMNEEVIKNNKNDLIELLSDEDKNKKYIEKLDELYQFNLRYERVKIDKKYERRKKEISKYDTLTYIKEYESKTNYIAGKFIGMFHPEKLSVEQLKKLINSLESDEVISNILKIYDEEFLVFKSCGLDIFENMYIIYKKYTLETIKNNLTIYIKNSYTKENISNNEYVCYISSRRKDSNRYLGNVLTKQKIHCRNNK